MEMKMHDPAVFYVVEVRGMSMKEAADMFGLSSSRFSSIKRYNETGKHEDRKGRGRKRTSIDEANIGESEINFDRTTKQNDETVLLVTLRGSLVGSFT